jgi:tetratricopeptide (TPR) repeat protein
VDESLWSDVMTQLGYPPNPKTLVALERLGAIQRKGRSWMFDHPGLQIAVAATVEGTSWGQEIHHQAARALAERHASAWDIGQHLEASGDKESPISPWLAAAYQAAVCESPHVAQQIQQKAIRSLQALGTSMDDPRWGHAILVQLHIDAQTKPFADAEEIARDLISRADNHGWHDILAEALEVHMRILHALGRYRDALEAGERARLTIRVEGNELTLARITGEMAEILHLTGRSTEALSHLHDALSAYRALDETEGMACALALAGDILAPEKPMKARECYEEALEFTRRMSLSDLEAHILEGMARVDHAQGKVTDAMLGFDRAEVTYGSVGATAVWITRYHRGYVRLRAGQREGLLEVFDQCAEVFAEIGVHRYSMNATAALLECASIENDQFLIMTQLRVLEAELDPLDRCAEIETPLREAHAALSKRHVGLARTVRELLVHIGAE